MSFGVDVWVEMMGSKLEANTMEATGFHKAMLVISWCAWRTVIDDVVVASVGSVNCITNLLLYLSMNLIEYQGLMRPLASFNRNKLFASLIRRKADSRTARTTCH